MLQHQMWYCYHGAIDTELRQCRDEGRDVSALEEKARAIGITAPYTEEEYNTVMATLDELEALPLPADADLTEPNALEAIHAAALPRRAPIAYDKETIADKIYGAWLGRVTGCLIGKPVENRSRDYIRTLASSHALFQILKRLG